MSLLCVSQLPPFFIVGADLLDREAVGEILLVGE
jgi:hypothetical protein